MDYPFFQLGQAVAILESCHCEVREAQMLSPSMMQFQVIWANTSHEGLKQVTVTLEHWYPDEAHQWLRAYSGPSYDPAEKSEGVYLAEVLGPICRIWATG